MENAVDSPASPENAWRLRKMKSRGRRKNNVVLPLVGEKMRTVRAYGGRLAREEPQETTGRDARGKLKEDRQWDYALTPI